MAITAEMTNPLPSSAASTSHITTSTNCANETISNQPSPPPSPFPWQDINSYKQRLQSYTNSNDATFCVPIEISPIITSRFGWKRHSPISNSHSHTHDNHPDNINFKNDNDDADSNNTIMISCQNEPKCNGAICIKFHPLLSMESKLKLTFIYREMLADCHSVGCAFKYDALSWLKEKDVGKGSIACIDTTSKSGSLATSSTSSNHDNDGDDKNDDDGDNMRQCVVPPYLINISKEYEILDSGAKFITEFIKTQSKRLVLQCSRKHQTLAFSSSLETPNTLKNVGKRKSENCSNGSLFTMNHFLEEQIMQRMMDIFVSVTGDTVTTRKSGEQEEVKDAPLLSILQNIATVLNKFSLIHLKQSDDGNSVCDELNEVEKQLQSLQYDLYNVDEEKDNHDYLLSPSSSSFGINLGVLLLSIFGWRLYKGEAQGAQDHVDCVQCKLCLNCSPLPNEFIMEDSLLQCEGSELDGVEESDRQPPAKKIRLNAENLTIDEETADGPREHKFDLINSHRYYCPFVCGFHTLNREQISKAGKNMDEMGTSTPCWEVIWKSIVELTVCSVRSDEKQRTVEWLSAIRAKIRSSILCRSN